MIQTMTVKRNPVRNIKLFSKRISLFHSTDMFENDLEVGHEEEPAHTKGI